VVGEGETGSDPDDDEEEMSATQPANRDEQEEDVPHPTTPPPSTPSTTGGNEQSLRRSPRITNRPVNPRLLMEQWLSEEKAEKKKVSSPATTASAPSSVLTRAFGAVSTSGSGEESDGDFEKSARKSRVRNTRKERKEMEKLFAVEGEGDGSDHDENGTWKLFIWCPFAAHFCPC
jgi:hypothetical protein